MINNTPAVKFQNLFLFRLNKKIKKKSFYIKIKKLQINQAIMCKIYK